jgi:hypothetical protein
LEAIAGGKGDSGKVLEDIRNGLAQFGFNASMRFRG